MSTKIRKNPYNQIMNLFCNRLKELRKNKELTQKEFAKILQTNNSSICDWECGRTQPDLDTLAKIAIYFETSTDFLLGLEDEAGTKTYSKYHIGTLNNNGGTVDMK